MGLCSLRPLFVNMFGYIQLWSWDCVCTFCFSVRFNYIYTYIYVYNFESLKIDILDWRKQLLRGSKLRKSFKTGCTSFEAVKVEVRVEKENNVRFSSSVVYL